MTPMVLAATAPDIAVFVVAAIIVIGGALGVVINHNPVHSALCLVATLFGIAVLFVAQDADFLAAVQVIVYAGAIVVLFLFVIMLLGVDKSDRISRDRIPAVKPIAVVFSVAILCLVGVISRWHWKATGASSQGGVANGPGANVGKLADSIFTQYLFAFEATALLLVIAVVGAVVLARRPDDADSADQVESAPSGFEPDVAPELTGAQQQ